MLTLWSLLHVPILNVVYHYMDTMAEINFSCKKRSLKHSLYVRQVGQNWSLFQCHKRDFLSSLVQGNIEVGSPAINLWNAVYTATILQLKLQFFNTSYWISISLDICISLALSDHWKTSVHGYWYHGRLRDKNLVQEAVSTSHGDMLMVSKDSVCDTAFWYEYKTIDLANS